MTERTTQRGVPLFYERLAENYPFLEHSLRAARINKKPGAFAKESFLAALIFSGIIGFVLLIFSLALDLQWYIAPLFFIIFFAFMIYYFINKPRHEVIRSENYVEAEIVSVIRFLILEVRTERSLYNALINASKNFSTIGIYLDEIIDEVKMGKTLEKALTEAVELCPSTNLRNVYWQLLNSLQTGADITESLRVLLADVVEEQKIRIEEYGRELNAFSLFYMMIAIIIPTVGFTIVTAILTFVGFPISLGLLIFLWVVLTVIQYFFLMLTADRRPAVEAY